MDQQEVKEPYINEHASDKVGVPLVWLCSLIHFAEYNENRKLYGASEGILNRYAEEAKSYLNEYIDQIEEELAQMIYEGWKDQDGWVPWVPRGNSLKQGEARRQAQEDLHYLAQLAKENQNG